MTQTESLAHAIIPLSQNEQSRPQTVRLLVTWHVHVMSLKSVFFLPPPPPTHTHTPVLNIVNWLELQQETFN